MAITAIMAIKAIMAIIAIMAIMAIMEIIEIIEIIAMSSISQADFSSVDFFTKLVQFCTFLLWKRGGLFSYPPKGKVCPKLARMLLPS